MIVNDEWEPTRYILPARVEANQMHQGALRNHARKACHSGPGRGTREGGRMPVLHPQNQAPTVGQAGQVVFRGVPLVVFIASSEDRSKTNI